MARFVIKPLCLGVCNEKNSRRCSPAAEMFNHSLGVHSGLISPLRWVENEQIQPVYCKLTYTVGSPSEKKH